MRIATHHIHNVLRAYARRLRHIQASAGNKEVPRVPASLEDKRRLVASKISMGMIEKMVLTRHPHPVPIRPASRLPDRAGRFTYRRLTPSGETVTAHLEMEDPGFLLREMEAGDE